MKPSQIAKIDTAIQRGRGAAAQVLGQSYAQYRLTNATNNSVVSGTPVNANFLARIAKAKKQSIENQVFDLQVFSATCDNTTLQFGDILVESGYESDGGQYAVAQKRPTRETLLVRVERNASITRPNPLGGAFTDQPASGSAPARNYVGPTKSSELVLTLTNGSYSFQPSGTFAAVPFGLQPQNRMRNGHKPDFPTQVPEVHFLGYLPYLPGVQIVENDVINSDSSDRYVVGMVYQSDDVGFQGYLLGLIKMAV